MAENKGYAYEKHIRDRLNEYGMIHHTDSGVIGHATNPDIIVNWNETPVVVELKLGISAADFGQVNFHYVNKKWIISPKAKNKEFVAALKAFGVEKFINAQWGKHGEPEYFKAKRAGMRATNDHMIKDQKNFTEIFFDCPQNLIDTYYGAKGVDYIQIKGMGVYKIKGTRPIPLTIPLFAPKIRLRIRVKKSGDGDADDEEKNVYYSFNGAIVAKKGAQVNSPYNMDDDLSFLIPTTRVKTKK